MQQKDDSHGGQAESTEDRGSSQRSGPVAENQGQQEAQQVIPNARAQAPILPTQERFEPNHPVVHQAPAQPAAILDDSLLCGNCPGWKQHHPQAPFGQCLPAIRWLSATMFTPNLAGCTLPLETKAKGATH